MISTYLLVSAHYLLTTLLLISGAAIPFFMVRGRFLSTMAGFGEAAVIWYAGSLVSTRIDATHASVVAYAPFVGATISFLLLSVGMTVYDGLVDSPLYTSLPAGLRDRLDRLFGNPAPPERQAR